MRVLGFFCLLTCIACQTVPVEKKEAPKKNPTIQEPFLPEKPARIDMAQDDLDCRSVQKLTMVSCLYPEIEVPFPYCEEKDSYAILGMIPFALCTGDDEILVQHLPYAKTHYRPTTVGLMQRAIKKISGEGVRFSRPLVYTKGLRGQDALLMMQAIYLEWKVSGSFNQPMKDVITEQASREPGCLFYQFLRDSVSHDYSRSLAIAAESKSRCSYYKHFDIETIRIDIYYVQDLLRKAVR